MAEGPTKVNNCCPPVALSTLRGHCMATSPPLRPNSGQYLFHDVVLNNLRHCQAVADHTRLFLAPESCSPCIEYSVAHARRGNGGESCGGEGRNVELQHHVKLNFRAAFYRLCIKMNINLDFLF
jgi:hypothetical protein